MLQYPHVLTGVDPGFSIGGGGGGGGRKRLCARTHIMSAEPNSLSAGVQGPVNPNPIGLFWGLESIGGGGGGPPQISATNGPIDLKIGTVVKQDK